MKKIYNFAEKSELPKCILPVKVNYLIGFQDGNKKFAEIRAGSLSRLVALLCMLALQCEPARQLTVKKK